MAKKGFTRNHKNIGDILKNDPKLQAALRAIAEDLAQKSGGTVEEYESKDRFVAGVKVPAHAQAKDGVLTKAVGSRGGTLS